MEVFHSDLLNIREPTLQNIKKIIMECFKCILSKTTELYYQGKEAVIYHCENYGVIKKIRGLHDIIIVQSGTLYMGLVIIYGYYLIH